MRLPVFPVTNIWSILHLRSSQSGDGDPGGSDSGSASQKVARSPGAELVERYSRLAFYAFFAFISLATCPLEQAHRLSWDWVSLILVRNLAVEFFVIGGWHWLVYESPWGTERGAMKEKKYNPTNQYTKGTSNLRREMTYTTLGFVVAALYEVVMLHLWATNTWVQPHYSSLVQFPLWSLLHVAIVPYWRELHFYAVHRFMHPWRWTIKGVDPGKVIYRHVHSLHHKSYNPGPWSGLSMHPVELTLYFSCTLLPFLFSLHPFHFYFNLVHAELSPIAGHDGHDNPGGGSFFHYLHHAHFECNYGTPMVPLDKFFGTYEDGSRWIKQDKKQ